MHPPYSALTILLFGFAGLFLLVAAREWRKLSNRIDGDRPISFRNLEAPASMTALALLTLGLAVLWFALVVLEQA